MLSPGSPEQRDSNGKLAQRRDLGEKHEDDRWAEEGAPSEEEKDQKMRHDYMTQCHQSSIVYEPILPVNLLTYLIVSLLVYLPAYLLIY